MRNEKGAAFIELLLVLPILFIMLAAGFEISRTIRFKNAAIQLSYQAASEAFRECTSERAIILSECVNRVQRDMSQFAAQISGDEDGSGTSHVAITVFFMFDNDGNPNTPRVMARYTARADRTETELVGNNKTITFPVTYNGNGRHGTNIMGVVTHNWTCNANGDWCVNKNGDAQTILNNLNQVVVAQAYVKYKPIGLLMGGERIFTDNYITDFTIL